MAPKFEDLTSTFVFSVASRTDKGVLAELPKGLPLDPARQRQGHHKSKTGCDNCKRRRVKCNEETPCAGCRRRGEWCERPEKTILEKRLRPAIPRPMATMAPSTSASGPSDAAVNLLHLKLLHHFQTHTCSTLVFGPETWAATLQLSFRFEFLANAMLCVAARHLSSLRKGWIDPDASSYAAAAAGHLCRALAGFRHELLTEDFFTATHLDAFIATSTLLQFELWSSIDFLPQGQGGLGLILDMERDRLFTFSASLKQVFLQTVPEALRRQPASVFMPYIQHNPTAALTEHARISRDTAAAYRVFFGRRLLDDDDMKGVGSMQKRLKEKLPPFKRLDSSGTSLWQPSAATALSPEDGSYTPVIDGLCLLMSFLPDAQLLHPDSTAPKQLPASWMADFTRCVFTFPFLCRGSFVAMLHDNDLDAFFVLYHFYRAIRQLLPDEACWWAHGRATVMEKALHDWLQIT